MRTTLLMQITFFPLAVTAFLPAITKPSSPSLALHLSRREVVITVVASLVVPEVAHAASSTFFFDDKIELVNEASQQATDGKIDLNAAFVGDYKPFRGMFPNAAGKIASHGPYKTVEDIYKIEGLTARDKMLFKNYQSEFTVNPPGRTFNERINSRVST